MYGTAWKKGATAQLVQLAVAAGFTAIEKPTTHRAVNPAAVNAIRHERFI